MAIWGVFVTAGLRNGGRQTHTDPSLSSTDPSEAAQAYWLAARRVSQRCAREVKTPNELQRQVSTIKTAADGKRVWAELAKYYSQAGTVINEAVTELKSLPRDRVDPVAVECVTELAAVLILQANLLRQSGEECGEMASLFAMIHAEGDAFDENSPKAREYDSQEENLISRMERTAENEGAVEKRRLAELATKANSAAAILAKKHGRDFPDLLGH